MKKGICLLMTLCLLLALPAIANPIPAAAESAKVGGWTVSESMEIDEKAQAAFDKAMEGLVGVNYTPIQLVGTQLVSGTNYCFLTEATVVYPGAQPNYALVYVYEDLQGEAKITNIVELSLEEVLSLSADDVAALSQPEEAEPEAEAEAEPEALGEWEVIDELKIDEKAQSAFDQATSKLLDVDYTPIQLVGTQPVSGTNYCFLSETQTVYPGAQPNYALVYIYENLQGEAEVTHVVDLSLEEVLNLSGEDIAELSHPSDPELSTVPETKPEAEAEAEPAAEAEAEAEPETAAEAEPAAEPETAAEAEPAAEPEAAAEAEPEAEPEPEPEAEPGELVKLPEFEYTGDDPYYDSVWQFLKVVNLANFAPAQVMIPEFVILREDDSDPEDIKVWGHFWLMNYDLEGSTLVSQSGGDYPGLYHLLPVEDGYQVFTVDEVEDGSAYTESVNRIFGVDQALVDEFFNPPTDGQDFRKEIIRMYAEDTGLDIKAYQDYGWDPVPVAD